LVVAALSTCMITTAGISAQNDGVNINGTRVYAEKYMSSEPPRRIAKVVVRIDVSAGMPHEYRSKFEHVCRTCPVALSLNSGILVDLKFQYPD